MFFCNMLAWRNLNGYALLDDDDDDWNAYGVLISDTSSSLSFFFSPLKYRPGPVQFGRLESAIRFASPVRPGSQQILPGCRL